MTCSSWSVGEVTGSTQNGSWVAEGQNVGGMGVTVAVGVAVGGTGVGVATCPASLIVRAKMLNSSTSARAFNVRKSAVVGSASHRPLPSW